MGYGAVTDLDAEGVRRYLLAADRDLADAFGTGFRHRLVLVGGAPLILLGYIPRMTEDIDAWEGVTEPLAGLLGRNRINNRVRGVGSFPVDFEDRLLPLDLGCRVLDLWRATLEDTVASKLAAGRPKDVEDIRQPAVLRDLDWGLMDRLAPEMRQVIDSDFRYREWLFFYGRYREEWGPRV